MNWVNILLNIFIFTLMFFILKNNFIKDKKAIKNQMIYVTGFNIFIIILQVVELLINKTFEAVDIRTKIIISASVLVLTFTYTIVTIIKQLEKSDKE